MSGSNGINGVGGNNGAGGQGHGGGGGIVGGEKDFADGAVNEVANFLKGDARGQGGEGGVVNRNGAHPTPGEGPGNRGQGLARGHANQNQQQGPNGPQVNQGHHNGHDKHARLLADQGRVQQFLHKITRQLPDNASRLQDAPRDLVRGRGEGGGREVDDDSSRVRFRSHVGDDRGRVDSDERGHRGFEREMRGGQRLFDSQSLRGLAHGAHEGGARGGAHELVQSAVGYLRGTSGGADLPATTRAALDTARGALGSELAASLNDKATGKVLRIVERALEHVSRAAEHGPKHGETFARTTGHVGHSPEHMPDMLRTATGAPDHLAREMADELLGAALLGRHLKNLEKTGGVVVQQAEAAIARALYGPTGGERPQGSQLIPASAPEPRLHPQEILRDLRAGAFLPAHEQHNPFPLTGRARIVAEMMELMRTFDAVEGAIRRAAAQVGAAQKTNAEASVGALLRAHLAGTFDGTLDELMALLHPTLPGRAARYEIPRTVAAMNGLLTDADGRALLAKDGTPLKLDRLVWLSVAGGLLSTSFLGGAFDAETFPTRLSPLLLYGFDAIYSVIGFDGRTLAAPHFVAVQTAANDSESEWVFGQQPLTPGWMRELIERLKDSAAVEHNLLGETLEEALVDGRFHAAMLSVAVEEGEPVADSSAVKRLLPGASGELAFA